METKTTAIIATVAILALIAIGIGYAYTSTVETTDNTISSEDILVLPYIGNDENPSFSNTTAAVDYDTKYSNSWSYGIINGTVTVGETNGYVKLVPIDKLVIKNEGSKSKVLKELNINIVANSNPTLVNQLNGTTPNVANTDTPMYNNTVKMYVTYTSTGENPATVWQEMTNGTGADKNVKFTLDFTDITNLDKTIAANGTLELGFYYLILGDGAEDATGCPHSAKLNSGAFTMQYKATADASA